MPSPYVIHLFNFRRPRFDLLEEAFLTEAEMAGDDVRVGGVRGSELIVHGDFDCFVALFGVVAGAKYEGRSTRSEAMS